MESYPPDRAGVAGHPVGFICVRTATVKSHNLRRRIWSPVGTAVLPPGFSAHLVEVPLRKEGSSGRKVTAEGGGSRDFLRGEHADATLILNAPETFRCGEAGIFGRERVGRVNFREPKRKRGLVVAQSRIEHLERAAPSLLFKSDPSLPFWADTQVLRHPTQGVALLGDDKLTLSRHCMDFSYIHSNDHSGIACFSRSPRGRLLGRVFTGEICGAGARKKGKEQPALTTFLGVFHMTYQAKGLLSGAHAVTSDDTNRRGRLADTTQSFFSRLSFPRAS